MPKTSTKPRAAPQEFKLLTRWCSNCIGTSPRKITRQGEPDEVDCKFWKNHTVFEATCGGCGNSTKDFFTPSQIDSMKSVGILR